MKKFLLPLFLIILLVFAGFAGTFAQKEKPKGEIMDKKILIAYFSWSGNTKSVAEKIQSSTGGDMFEIQTAKPYPTDYNETAYGVAKEQHEKNIFPELKENKDVSDYDVIFIGTPAWWYTMAPAVKTFLRDNNFEGKTIVPFVTHGGGGGYRIDKDMEELAKGSTVKKPFVSYGRTATQEDVNSWLNEL